ncbi:MAG: NifU family protein [Myxococcota bacterium]
MIRSGVRRLGRGLKRRIKGMLGDSPTAPTNASEQAGWSSAPAASAAPASRPAAPPAGPAPVSPFAAEPSGADAAETPSDTAGAPLTVEQVEALFEDMVRPALQSDGGDIDLVKVEDNDVYVRLVGACSSCPSSTVTMKMGVERLLAEEFPQFRQLIQVA